MFDYKAYRKAWNQKNAEKIRVQRRARYADKREDILAKKKAWRVANPEREKKARKRWREKNLEKARARDRDRYKTDPTKFCEASQKWRRENPTKRRDGFRRWVANNRDRSRELKRLAYARNPLPVLVRAAVWRKANPQRVRVSLFRYRYRFRSASGLATAAQIKARVDFFGGVCSYCGGPFEHLDHAIPISRGGTNWPANLRPACRRCNCSKSSKTAIEFLSSSARRI